MKLLIPILLLTINSFSQTGKIKQSPLVDIRFETLAGVTTIVIKNGSPDQSEIEYKYNGLMQTVNLPWGGEFKFTTLDSYFLIEARNVTQNSEWIEADSRIRALEITAEKQSRILPPKIQCDETIISSFPSDDRIRVRKKPV